MDNTLFILTIKWKCCTTQVDRTVSWNACIFYWTHWTFCTLLFYHKPKWRGFTANYLQLQKKTYPTLDICMLINSTRSHLMTYNSLCHWCFIFFLPAWEPLNISKPYPLSPFSRKGSVFYEASNLARNPNCITTGNGVRSYNSEEFATQN